VSIDDIGSRRAAITKYKVFVMAIDIPDIGFPKDS
jgi:hypothetical protein